VTDGPPSIDPHWIPTEHLHDVDRLVLQLPREPSWLSAWLGTAVGTVRVVLDGDGLAFDGLRLSLADVQAVRARWNTLSFRTRHTEVGLELQMTGRELASLRNGLQGVMERLRRGEQPTWVPKRIEATHSPPLADPNLVDPRWIAPWARPGLTDRLHIRFPSDRDYAYLRLRHHDVAFAEGGQLVVEPIASVRRVRVRGERIEVLFDDAHWSRVARMTDVERHALVRAIQAFVERNQGPTETPPAALLDLLD
jgi:hypothetical protein